MTTLLLPLLPPPEISNPTSLPNTPLAAIDALLSTSLSIRNTPSWKNSSSSTSFSALTIRHTSSAFPTTMANTFTTIPPTTPTRLNVRSANVPEYSTHMVAASTTMANTLWKGAPYGRASAKCNIVPASANTAAFAFPSSVKKNVMHTTTNNFLPMIAASNQYSELRNLPTKNPNRNTKPTSSIPLLFALNTDTTPAGMANAYTHTATSPTGNSPDHQAEL